LKDHSITDVEKVAQDKLPSGLTRQHSDIAEQQAGEINKSEGGLNKYKATQTLSLITRGIIGVRYGLQRSSLTLMH
jgi:hypothetical protein